MSAYMCSGKGYTVRSDYSQVVGRQECTWHICLHVQRRALPIVLRLPASSGQTGMHMAHGPHLHHIAPPLCLYLSLSLFAPPHVRVPFHLPCPCTASLSSRPPSLAQHRQSRMVVSSSRHRLPSLMCAPYLRPRNLYSRNLAEPGFDPGTFGL